MKDEIKEIRDCIACPQLGDDYYGEWGALRLDQRLKIKSLLDYITNLRTIEQQYGAVLSENAELENKITNLQEENERLNNVINGVEEYLNKDFEFYEKYKKYVEFGYMLCKKGLLDKLKELKEGK